MTMRRLILGAIAAVIIFVPTWARCAEPLKIRYGWTAVPIEMMPIAFRNEAILHYLGKSYEPVFVHFNGSGPLLTALATGEVDMCSFSAPALGSAILNGHVTNLRIVADGFQDGVAGHASTDYVVRKDSPIKTVDQLKGKVLGVNAMGGMADIAMRAMMYEHHLVYDKDYTEVEIPFPDMGAAIESKRVDLGAMVPPFSYTTLDRGIGRVLFTSKDAIGPAQAIFIVARAGFIAQHREALIDFFEDYIRALHWYFSPANRQKAIEIISHFTKQPPHVFSSWVFTKKDFYHDPNAMPNLAMLQHNVETIAKLGLLKSTFNVRKYADLSLVKAARARLK